MTWLFRLFALLLVATWLPVAVCTAGSGQGISTEQKIERVKKERQRLAQVKKQLELQLGSIGKELHKLDIALTTARKASRDVHDKIKATDQQLLALKQQSKQLEKRISALKQIVLDQAMAAWQHSSHSSQWMGVLTGVSVSDIPHRRFLLNHVMRSEENDRRAYAESVAELARVETELQTKRQQLELLRQEKKQAESRLMASVTDKRKMIKRVRDDVRAKARKDSRLAREEKALMQMLDDMGADLLAIDRQQTAGVSIRKRKGHLKWPIRGRIVASYHSRPKAGMSRLQGVQLRPKNHARTVKAMAAGQVRYADWFGGYGLMTIIDYGDGLLGVYAHNNALYKQLGDWVEEGEVIADAGSTGWVNSVTLYFEIRDRGRAVNPKRWCRR
ncbi:MAG: peptidoglycan DD-metalloendopeptidase family protein [Mariprofundus sp.]|nr:peptidoglycan DD-metalloendopeptidase family protein [Mariprofundus sp.]